MATVFDAIVVGAGQNGLAAAARLAGAGSKGVVVERRGAVGGLAGAVEIHPGYRVPGILHDEGRVSPRGVARLGLERHGLALREAPPVFLAEEGGRGILVAAGGAAAAAEIGAPSRRDPGSHVRFPPFLARLPPLLESAPGHAPPPPPPSSPPQRGA